MAAWELAEESGGAAQARQASSNFNWLNIGYFDSGTGAIAHATPFSDPVSAAEQTAKFLKGQWGGASTGIRDILNTVGKPPDDQMMAIANSGGASSHYDNGANLRGTFEELNMKMSPRRLPPRRRRPPPGLTAAAAARPHPRSPDRRAHPRCPERRSRPQHQPAHPERPHSPERVQRQPTRHVGPRPALRRRPQPTAPAGFGPSTMYAIPAQGAPSRPLIRPGSRSNTGI